MINLTSVHRRLTALILTVAGIALAGCAGGTAPAGSTTAPTGEVSGVVSVDGSSTVLPVSSMVADAVQKAHPGVMVTVQATGTGGGFTRLCGGVIDIIGASRPINADEQRDCDAHSVEYIELPVAFDSLSVVMSRTNTFVTCLTVAELKRLWEPAAERSITRWNQIRTSFPDEPIALFAPGANSGTFDYFTLAIVGTERSSRKDFTASEDDEVLARGVADDPHAIGYFGYAYYREHQDTLKLVAVDNGAGCVTPSAATVADNTYVPLSRPIFVYVSKASASKPAVSALAHSYVDPQNAPRIQDVGYVPLPTATLLSASRRLDAGTTGSIFGGRGSVLGLTAATFEDDDRIQNALVR